MGSHPKVTVGIPTCCNRSRFLAESIRGILDQTLEDIELYVSNDGSTDDTPAVVASFEDPRVHYLELPRPGGLHANLNKCLQLGTTPFVAICQDDDYWLPSNLATLVEIMERHPDVGLAHGAFHMVDADGNLIKEWSAWGRLKTDALETGEAFIRRSMANVNRVNMSSALIRRTVLGNESFRRTDDVLCDTGLWLRLARRGDVAFVAEPLTALRVHPGSVSVAEGINEPGLRNITMHEIRLTQMVKKQFLTEYQYRQPELGRLRGVSRRWARRELLNAVTRLSGPARSPVGTLRLMWKAVRIEPSLIQSPRTWRVLLASLVGFKARRLARRLIGSLRPNQP